MPRLYLVRFLSVVALIGAVIGGIGYFSGSAVSQLRQQAPSLPYLVLSKPGFPSIIIESDNHTKIVNLFVSPTCNQCDVLVVNVLHAISNKDPHMLGVNVTFSLTPTSEDDYQIISGLMCVNSTLDFQRVFTHYYLDLYDHYGGQLIAADYAKALAWQLVQQKGTTANQYSQCLGNQAYRQAIANTFVIADKLRPRHVVPFIAYNDRPTDIQTFAGLEGLLSQPF